MMIDQLLTGRNLMLAGAIFVILTAMKTPFKDFWASHWGQRLLPVLPLVLGIGGGFLGLCDCATWQDKLLIGILAGFASANFFKVGKTTVLGYGLPEMGGGGAAEAPAATPAASATPVADKKE